MKSHISGHNEFTGYEWLKQISTTVDFVLLKNNINVKIICVEPI